LFSVFALSSWYLFLASRSFCPSSFSPRGLRFPTLTSRSHPGANLNTHLTLLIPLTLLGSRLETLVHHPAMDRARPQIPPSLLVRVKKSTQILGQIHNTTQPLLLAINPFNCPETILIKTFTLALPLKLLLLIPRHLKMLKAFHAQPVPRHFQNNIC